jgi:uncharacterized protein (TIGR02145 family)
MNRLQTILFSFLCAAAVQAQTVSNVKADFVNCQSQVQFDLSSSTPVDLTLYYSGDGGTTWIPCTTVSGDIQAQSTGSKTIVWDNAADGVVYGVFKFKVEPPQKEQGECVMIAGTCWATRNVDEFGTFTENPEDYGKFYQWNRSKAWAATGSVSGWDSSMPSGSEWEKANDPCPAGFRVPTRTEQQALVNAGSTWTTNYNGTGVAGRIFGSGEDVVFFPAAGCRGIDRDGTLYVAGTGGHYWSVTEDDSNFAYHVTFNSGLAFMGNSYRAYGRSVRCVSE